VLHCLSQDEALSRIKTLLGELKTQFSNKVSNLNEEWQGNTGIFSFTAMRFSVSGTLTVNSCEVELICNLPLAAIFFKNKIESNIRERIESLLT
jgi:hypothetical protein